MTRTRTREVKDARFTDSAVADKLYEMMAPEQILETLRMLVVHVADYRLRFGVVERRDLLELVGAMELTDEQTQLRKDGNHNGAH